MKKVENRPKRSKSNPQADYSPRSDMQDLEKMETKLLCGSKAQESLNTQRQY